MLTLLNPSITRMSNMIRSCRISPRQGPVAEASPLGLEGITVVAGRSDWPWGEIEVKYSY